MPKVKSEQPVNESARTSAHVGESVAVELRGGGATGFAWEPTEPLPDGVKIEKEQMIPNPQFGMVAWVENC